MTTKHACDQLCIGRREGAETMRGTHIFAGTVVVLLLLGLPAKANSDVCRHDQPQIHVSGDTIVLTACSTCNRTRSVSYSYQSRWLKNAFSNYLRAPANQCRTFNCRGCTSLETHVSRYDAF
jgi:hypothetical protein